MIIIIIIIITIAHNDLLVSDTLLESFHGVKIADATLLAAPFYSGSALDKAWDDRCQDLARAADRLREINSQDALILLRSQGPPSSEMFPISISPFSHKI